MVTRFFRLDVQVRRFLTAFAVSVVTMAAVVAALNAIVDPLGVVPGSVSVKGINADKVLRHNNDRVHKPLDLRLARPRTVVLGTSRILQAFDPGSMAGTPYAPVYNYGLAGGDIDELEGHLEKFIAATPSVRHVFVELFLPRLVARTARSVPDRGGLLASTLFSWSALQQSAETVWQNRPTRAGARASDPVVLADGRQSFVTMSTLPSFLAYPAGFIRRPLPYAMDPAVLEAMRRMRDGARARGITLTFFLSPSHAVHLYALHLTGRWPTLEAWKRAFAREFDVVDFTAYTAITEEPASSEMRYWRDPHHFSALTAEMIAARLTGRDRDGDGFGVPLASGGLEDELRAWRDARDRWIARNPGWVALFDLARAGQDTDVPAISGAPGGIECPVRIADALASRLTPPHASRTWLPLASRTTLDPPIVVDVRSMGDGPGDVEATCELTIESAPDTPSARPVDWRIGHALGSPSALRGRTLRYTVRARASVPTALDTGTIYVYDGRVVSGTPLTALTPAWRTATIEHTVSQDASRLEVWLRLVSGAGTIRPIGQRIAFEAAVELADDRR